MRETPPCARAASVLRYTGQAIPLPNIFAPPPRDFTPAEQEQELRWIEERCWVKRRENIYYFVFYDLCFFICNCNVFDFYVIYKVS